MNQLKASAPTKDVNTLWSTLAAKLYDNSLNSTSHHQFV